MRGELNDLDDEELKVYWLKLEHQLQIEDWKLKEKN